DALAAVARDLDRDVGRGAEPVETETLGVTRQAQGAIADQSGAEQRRGVDVGVLGIAAVDLIAGEAGAHAQVLAAADAVAAFPAGPAEPRNADPVPRPRMLDADAGADHRGDDLVP